MTAQKKIRAIRIWNELIEKIAEFRQECMKEFSKRCKDDNSAGGSLAT